MKVLLLKAKAGNQSDALRIGKLTLHLGENEVSDSVDVAKLAEVASAHRFTLTEVEPKVDEKAEDEKVVVVPAVDVATGAVDADAEPAEDVVETSAPRVTKVKRVAKAETPEALDIPAEG